MEIKELVAVAIYFASMTAFLAGIGHVWHRLVTVPNDRKWQAQCQTANAHNQLRRLRSCRASRELKLSRAEAALESAQRGGDVFGPYQRDRVRMAVLAMLNVHGEDVVNHEVGGVLACPKLTAEVDDLLAKLDDWEETYNSRARSIHEGVMDLLARLQARCDAEVLAKRDDDDGWSENGGLDVGPLALPDEEEEDEEE